MSPELLLAASTPMGVFVIAVFCCNSVFAYCSMKMKDKELFKYAIHMFLAVVFYFGTILLFSPGSLYHPAQVREYDMVKNPWGPTLLIAVGAIIYTLYHGLKYFHDKKGKNLTNS